MWQENIAQVELDLPIGTDGRVVRALAGYMSLGDRGSVARAVHLAQTQYGVTLDPALYKGKKVFFAFDEDADNDGTANLSEWQGSGFFDPFDAHLANYLAFALDPKLEGEGFPSGGGSSGEDCGDCIKKVNVAEGFSIGGSVNMPTGELPLGTTIKLVAVPDEDYRFVQWACNDCLIGGSRVKSEKLLLTPADSSTPPNTHTISALFARNIAIVPDPDPEYTVPPLWEMHYSYSGGRLDDIPGSGFKRLISSGEEPFVLTAVVDQNVWAWRTGYGINNSNMPLSGNYLWGNPDYELVVRWVNEWGGAGSSTPEYVWGNTVTTYGGNWYAEPFLIKKGRLVEIAVGATVGGIVTVGRGFNVLLALGKGLFYMNKDELDLNFFMGANAEPNPGYIFNGWVPPLPSGNPSYAYWIGVVAEFEEKEEYTLDIEIEGCGHVSVSPAVKYYPKGTEVTITAHPAGLCCWEFTEWTGGSVEGNTNITVKVIMNRNMDITAKFLDMATSANTGGTVYYARSNWRGSGYDGDFFHVNYNTGGDPDGWDWSNVTITEKLCYLSDDFGLSEAEKKMLSSADPTAIFKIESGVQNVLVNGVLTSKQGNWIVGQDGGGPDQHSIDTSKFFTIRDHFIDGPGTPKTIRLTQMYLINGQGNNPMPYPKRVIAQFELVFTFYKIIPDTPETPTCYILFIQGAHQIVKKGGVQHPCAGSPPGEFWTFCPNSNSCKTQDDILFP